MIYAGADISRVGGAAGKLGCLARLRGGNLPVLLSNAHILAFSGSAAPRSGDPITSPPDAHDPTLAPNVIAKLLRWTPFDSGTDYPNVVDAAVAQILDPNDVNPAIAGIGLPAGINTELRAGMQVQMATGTTVRTGTIVNPSFSCEVGYLMPPGSLQTFGFRQQVQCTAYSDPGNSGSAVLDMQNCIVGLHLGGSDTNSVFTPIRNVLALLDVEIITTTDAASADAANAATPLGFIPPVGSYYAATDTLARTVWGESRGEPEEGQVAVSAVVANRARAQQGRWGLTVEAVCLKAQQFSCWNPQDANYQRINNVGPDDATFASCLTLARQTLQGQIADPTQGATFYANLSTAAPSWASSMVRTTQIGHHTFFREP
jgi:N-acetylmuramoyl-L-alanine amidase